MSNIADLIENYILRQLAAQEDGHVELRRTEIADKISCAPSQISYVLSTRFTPARGFRVESRRGLGGFIRIAQVPMRQLVYQDMQEKIDEDTEFSVVQSMVAYLLKHQMITNRLRTERRRFCLRRRRRRMRRWSRRTGCGCCGRS